MNSTSKRKEKIASMFDEIAPNYDAANHFLSLGIDKAWRKKIKKLIRGLNQPACQILDVATGTGDLAFDIAHIPDSHVVGIDISQKMLDCALLKKEKTNSSNVQFFLADGANIPYADGTFDVVTVAFGVRNFEDLSKGIAEIMRVLKPNGHYYVLELTRPQKFIGPFYRIYLNEILPLIGWIITRKKSAYSYLKNSIRDFYQDEKLNNYFVQSGFQNCSFQHLSFGIATLYSGKKGDDSILNQ